MNRLVGYQLSRVLNKIITTSTINHNLKLQLICTSNDICINMIESNISLIKRIEELENKLLSLEKCLDNKKSVVIYNEKPKSVLVIDSQR